MKKLVIALTAIFGTLSAVTVQAGQVTFGYADKGLSLTGIQQTFAKPQKGSNAKPLTSSKSLKMKGIEALGDMLYPDAVSYFKQAIAATNDAQEKTELKQYLYTTLRLGGGGSWAMTFPKQAIAMLNEAIAMKPNDFWLYARKGDAYCNMGQLAPCLANHNIAIKLNPDKANAVSRLAITLVHIDPQRSAKAFDLSIKLYKQRGDTRNAEAYIAAKSAFGL